jgi:GntR family transcriptional regulator
VVHFELPSGDHRPVYLQIAGLIRAAIARGELAPGDSLPPLRRLAPEIGVHANTVLQAYRELASAGVVETRRGRGTFVATTPLGSGERRVLADAVAERALRDAHDHGLTHDDLTAAIARAAAHGLG